MLTGDKQETAVNISHSCGHFQHDMEIMYLVQKETASQVQQEIEKIEKRYENLLFLLVLIHHSLLAFFSEQSNIDGLLLKQFLFSNSLLPAHIG